MARNTIAMPSRRVLTWVAFVPHIRFAALEVRVTSCVCGPKQYPADAGPASRAGASGDVSARSKREYPGAADGPIPCGAPPRRPRISLGQRRADASYHLIVRQHRSTPPALGLNGPFIGRLAGIVCRTVHTPLPVYPGLVINTLRGDRAGSAHGFDLRCRKGNSPSSGQCASPTVPCPS